MAKGSKYKVELWYRGQQIIGNIRKMTYSLRWSKKRNGVYTIDFSLDLKRFEEFCARIGETPENVLSPLITDVRIKVRNTYVIGAAVISDPPNFNQSNATIQVSCDGFLTLTGRRYITKDYNDQYTGNMIKDALQVVQAEANGSLGVAFNPASYLGNSATRDDTYVRQNIQEMIENRSAYITDPFDFEFAADRTLTLYETIGNPRPDTIITYPASSAEKNAIGALSMSMRHTGENVANRIIALGAGFGKEALEHIENDEASQIKYGIIEDVVVFNDVTVMSTLVEHAKVELRKRKEALILPTATVSGDDFYTDEYNIGDRVIMSQANYSKYATAGYYRIEEMVVDVDENDDEVISLTVDNVGIGSSGEVL